MIKKNYISLLMLLLFQLWLVKLYAQISIAHRGYSGEFPENTLLSFEQAIRYDIEYIELDVRMSKDDSLMVIHDKTLDRTTDGNGAIDAFLYSELKELDASYTEKYGNTFRNNKIPTLYEVLANFNEKVKFIIEAKNVSEIAIINLIQKMRLEESVIISSYNENKIKRITHNYPFIETALIVNRAKPSTVDLAVNIGADILLTSPYISKATYQYSLTNNIKVWFGIINSPQQIPHYVENSKYGIISNFPNIIKKSIEVPFTTFTDKNTFYIRPNDKKIEYSISIFDLSGKTLFYKKGIQGFFCTSLQSSSILYFLKIETKSGIYSFKRIIR